MFSSACRPVMQLQLRGCKIHEVNTSWRVVIALLILAYETVDRYNIGALEIGERNLVNETIKIYRRWNVTLAKISLSARKSRRSYRSTFAK